ncbi:solute carrier family 46 member 3-like [Patiria miniata]|uniref:Proton-coupled folate transporter n=1 Tax=Patiria miniata TaxID=46514 RepID=A0A914A453_PATMI|nr:solute carrier family 46 member 3-like [Patiria miniata]XP_038058155.1 solute carrier family 46 member 3-like [Patiria miniata]XP_038058156.1 solute carrier family 46 member 3-like [Patiria miniata]
MAIGRGIYKYLAAEHVLFVYMMASGLSIPTKTQYIERRIAKELGVGSYSEATCLTNKSSPDYEIQLDIQRQSTMWMLYITVCIQFPALIMSNVCGGISDRYGRHVPCAVPCIGLMLSYVISACVVYFELPLAVFLAGSLIVGVSGDLTSVVTGCAGYISDVTQPESKERTARFALIDVAFTSSNSLIQFAIGYVITLYGFAAPFYIGMVLIGVCACCIIFCLPDRRSYVHSPSTDTAIQANRPEEEIAQKNPINIFRNVYSLFRQAPGKPSGRGWRLCAYNFITCASIMLIVANSVISVLYTTGQPFCLTPVQEGYYGASMFAVFTGGTLLAVTVLQRFLSPFWIMHLTSVSIIASVVLVALAKTKLLLYISLIVGMFTYMAIPLSRSKMADLYEPDEQGVMFAFSGCLTSLAAFVTPLIFNAIYSSTLHFMPGFVYFVMALVAVLAWLVILILHVKEPKVSHQYRPLKIDDPDGLPTHCPDTYDDSTGHEEVGFKGD